MTNTKQDKHRNQGSSQAAVDFLEQVGNDDLLRFLRSLPMVAANDDGKITLHDLIYEMKLWPFVKEAWNDVEASSGAAGRILQLNRVYKLAAKRMKKITGEDRRVERVIDLPTFFKIYQSVGLP